MIESDWTIPAYAAREEMRRTLELSPRILQSERTLETYADGTVEKRPDPRAREPLRDTAVLASAWTLPTYAAREDMRRAQEASPAIMESDWTLEAYRQRTEALESSASTPSGAAINETARKAPEIRIDFPPAWLEQRESGRGHFPMKRLAYAAGIAAVVAMGAFAFRTETPVATTSTRPGKLEPLPQPVSLAPPPATAPAPAISTPSLAPPEAPQQAPHAAAGAGGNPPPAAAPSPANAPTPNKPEAGAQQAPAPLAAPERPAETKTSPPRKPRTASEPRQKPARERQREGRGAANWFEEVVKSVKRLGRVLTP